MNQDLMDLIVPVVGVAFAVLFIAFIFIKSAFDNKKEKKIFTEIFQKYGVKTNAEILAFKENEVYGRHGIVGKYNYFVKFRYSSAKIGDSECCYMLPTNNSKSKEYLKSEEIPVIHIPAYIDYYNELISREEFFEHIGHKLNLGYDCWLVIFAEDLGLFTNINQF